MAFEAARRSARVNPHELWAVLETVDEHHAGLVVDLGSDPAVWWAWWSTGAHVIAVSGSPAGPAGFSGERLPSSVVDIAGDPRDAAVRLRVADQVARRPVDVLVLAGLSSEGAVSAGFRVYAPMVRPGGLVLVHGIANRRCPGVGRFWSAVDIPDRKELIGSQDPDGYGVITIPRRETADHG